MNLIHISSLDLKKKKAPYICSDFYNGKLKSEGNCRRPTNLHGIWNNLSFFQSHDIDISVFQHRCFQMAKKFPYIMELTQFGFNFSHFKVNTYPEIWNIYPTRILKCTPSPTSHIFFFFFKYAVEIITATIYLVITAIWYS